MGDAAIDDSPPRHNHSPMLAVAFEMLGGDGDGGGSLPEDSRRGIAISQSLVARLRAQERDAYNELIDRAYASLVAIAASITGSDDTAQDVVQDILVWIWEQGESWHPGASPAAYIIGAVRHRALNVVRRRNVELNHRERIATDPERGNSQGTDWSTDVHDLEAALQRALTHLTERQRTAFLLRAQEKLTVPEVATALGIGVRAAEKLVSRSMRIVRDELRRSLGV